MLCPHLTTVAPPLYVCIWETLEVGGKLERGGEWLERMTLEIIAVPWGGPGWAWQGQHSDTGMKYACDNLH